MDHSNFWRTVSVLSQPAVAQPALSTPTPGIQNTKPTPGKVTLASGASLREVRQAVTSKPRKSMNLGPSAAPGAPKRSVGIKAGAMAPSSGYKRGLPTASATAAAIMDRYETLDDVESLLAAARLARNLKRRGFADSTTVNVGLRKPMLPVPGDFKGVPTVGKASQAMTPAEVSALPGLVGTVPQTMDPRAEQAFLKSRKTTTPQSVSPAEMVLPVGRMGGDAAVKTSNTPIQPSIAAQIRQLPAKIHDTTVQVSALIGAEQAVAAADQTLRVSAFRKGARAESVTVESA